MDREKVINCLNDIEQIMATRQEICPQEELQYWIELQEGVADAIAMLKEQKSVVHPEPSCEMKYITDCCCDLCGVQLIREDNFCRCCGKRIEWKSR